MSVDVFLTIEIVLKFFKATPTNRDFKNIALSYIFSTFIFDVVATMPGLFQYHGDLSYYWLKCFRLVHFYRINGPLVYIMEWLYLNATKNERAERIGFFSLLLYVFYLVHCLACIWISLGFEETCIDIEAYNEYGLCK